MLFYSSLGVLIVTVDKLGICTKHIHTELLSTERVFTFIDVTVLQLVLCNLVKMLAQI